MTQALILTSALTGSRVLVIDGVQYSEDFEWPFLETFDEVANAVSAMHLLTPEEAAARIAKAEEADAFAAAKAATEAEVERARARQGKDVRRSSNTPRGEKGAHLDKAGWSPAKIRARQQLERERGL